MKVPHKKRKESTSSITQSNLGSSIVPVNPSEDQPPAKAPALSMPSESFSLGNGGVKTYSLLFKVHQGSSSSLSNGNDLDHQDENDESSNGKENGDTSEPSSKRRKLSRDPNPGEPKLLTAELTVYDKHGRCMLTEGEYELVLAETEASQASKVSPKKNSSWQNITIDKSDMVRI